MLGDFPRAIAHGRELRFAARAVHALAQDELKRSALDRIRDRALQAYQFGSANSVNVTGTLALHYWQRFLKGEIHRSATHCVPLGDRCGSANSHRSRQCFIEMAVPFGSPDVLVGHYREDGWRRRRMVDRKPGFHTLLAPTRESFCS